MGGPSAHHRPAGALTGGAALSDDYDLRATAAGHPKSARAAGRPLLHGVNPPLLVTSALLEAVQRTFSSPPGGLAHALNLVTGLVTHPCIRVAAPWLLCRLLALLTARPAGLAGAEHLQAQEWLVSALAAGSGRRPARCRRRRCWPP